MNITDITNANITSISGAVGAASTLSGGVFAAGMFFVIYIIIYTMAYSRTYEIPAALAGSSFVMFIIATLMVLATWLSVWFAVLPLIVLSLTLFSMMRS